MSATTLRDPLVVRLQDGSSWVQRAVMQDGHGLYVLEGSVDDCPLQVMAPFRELAELGLASMTGVMAVGSDPVPMSDRRFEEIRNRRMDEVTAGPWLVADGAGGKPVVYVEEPLNGAVGARVLLAAEGASEADVQFVASARRSVPELVAEVDQLRARVAELERLLEVKDRPVDEDPILFELTPAADAEDPIRPCGCPKRFDRHAEWCPEAEQEAARRSVDAQFPVVAAFLSDEQRAALDTLRAGLPLDDPDRHDLDKPADIAFAQVAAECPDPTTEATR